MAVIGFPLEEHRPSGCHSRRFLFWKLPEDVSIIFDKDPAAKNLAEVLLYQGLHAIVLHRIAHRFYLRGVPFLPRLISLTKEKYPKLSKIPPSDKQTKSGAMFGLSASRFWLSRK